MKSIRDILREKGGQVWTIDADATIFAALELMAEKNVGALLALHEGAIVGIVSERDYARKVILKGKSSKDTPVREIMSPQVLYVRPDQRVEDCMALMLDKHIRHLPVIEEGRLIGLISIGDVVKADLSQKQFLIEQMENYITGKVS